MCMGQSRQGRLPFGGGECVGSFQESGRWVDRTRQAVALLLKPGEVHPFVLCRVCQTPLLEDGPRSDRLQGLLRMSAILSGDLDFGLLVLKHLLMGCHSLLPDRPVGTGLQDRVIGGRAW